MVKENISLTQFRTKDRQHDHTHFTAGDDGFPKETISFVGTVKETVPRLRRMCVQRFPISMQEQKNNQGETNDVHNQLPHPQQQHHRLMPSLVTFFFQINFQVGLRPNHFAIKQTKSVFTQRGVQQVQHGGNSHDKFVFGGGLISVFTFVKE